MDILVKLVEALAWPITILIIIFLFKKELAKIFTRLSSFKYKEFEAQFNLGLDTAEEKAKELPIEQRGDIKLTGSAEVVFDSKYARLREIAKLSPRSAISSAWFEVENVLYEINKESLKYNAPSFKLSQVLNDLVKKELISNSANDIFRELRQLRNQSVHYPEFAINQDEAERYIDVALKLSGELIKVKEKLISEK